MAEESSLDPSRTVDHVRASVRCPGADSTVAQHSLSSTGPHLPSPPADVPGISGYAVTGEIARGGMGRVYAGRDRTLEREVAIKTLLPGADAARFVTEAKITARLPHPGIPPVHALGTLDDGTPYLVMKLIHGRTLAAVLEERSSPADGLPGLVQVFEQIAQAVGFAHSQGIIHRDLKPQNVMVGVFGEVQVMDWGLAKDLAAGGDESGQPGECDDVTQTAAGAVMGTPAYMAPEQARGEPADARADVFALGGILTAVLTGRPPLGGKDMAEVISRAGRADLSEALARLDASGADAELIALARHCLSARAKDRPADAGAVAAEVAGYRAGVEARLRRAEAEAAAAVVREAEQRKRRRVWYGLTAVLLLGVVASSVLAVWANAARQEAEIARQGEARRAESEKEARQREQTAREQAQAAKERETQEKANAVAVRDFLRYRLLRPISPWERVNRPVQDGKRGQDALTVRELLDSAAREFGPKTIAARFPGQPLVQAEILETIGETYQGLGDYPQALLFVKASAELRERHFGRTHPATLLSLVDVAFVNLRASRQAEAMQVCLEVVGRLESLMRDLPGPALGANAASPGRH